MADIGWENKQVVFFYGWNVNKQWVIFDFINCDFKMWIEKPSGSMFCFVKFEIVHTRKAVIDVTVVMMFVLVLSIFVRIVPHLSNVEFSKMIEIFHLYDRFDLLIYQGHQIQRYAGSFEIFYVVTELAILYRSVDVFPPVDWFACGMVIVSALYFLDQSIPIGIHKRISIK